MKRFLQLLMVLTVMGVLFTGAASAATVGLDSFNVENAANVMQTGNNSFDAIPMKDMVSLVATPGNSFYQQNGQLYYKTPNNTYAVNLAGATACAVTAYRADVYTSDGLHVTFISDRPFALKITKYSNGWGFEMIPV